MITLQSYTINGVNELGSNYSITFTLSDGTTIDKTVSFGTFQDIPNGKTAGQQLDDAIQAFAQVLIASLPQPIPTSIESQIVTS